MDRFQERKGVRVGCLVNYFKVGIIYLVIMLFFVLSNGREWRGSKACGYFETIRNSSMFANPAVKASGGLTDVSFFAERT